MNKRSEIDLGIELGVSESGTYPLAKSNVGRTYYDRMKNATEEEWKKMCTPQEEGFFKKRDMGRYVTFACIGDLHFDIRPITRLIERIDCFDAVLVAGDITQLGTEYDIESMCFHLNRIGKPVFLVAGNHDRHFEKERNYGDKISNMYCNVHYLENSYAEFKGVTIYGTPYVVECPKQWSFRTSDLNMNKYMPKRKVDVLLTHCPPSLPGISDIESTFGGMRDLGSETIREYIKKYQPQYNICGHIHENGGLTSPIRDTMVVNASEGITLIHVSKSK